MKFNHLNVPSHWKNYWTRYPEGHTILEALISWVSQVDSMVDNQNKLNDNVEQFRNEIDVFVGRFDERLQDEVTQTLNDWQKSGFLDVVISEALQWQLTDYIATNEADKSSLNTQLQQIENATKNAPQKMSFLNGYGNDQNIHPKVLDFGTLWNGYQYWMAYTPFPFGDASKENPSIARANNMMKWQHVKTLDEPVDMQSIQYNNDTHLVFRYDLNRLECWWRFYDGVNNHVTIYRSTSTNGTTWTAKEQMMEVPLVDELLSPAIIFENNVYKMWYVKNYQIHYHESADGKTWSNNKLVLDRLSNVAWWHLDVIRTDVGYEFIIQGVPSGATNAEHANLYYTKTSDNVVFDPTVLILEPSHRKGAFDDQGIYRSTFIKQNDVYYVFYSAFSSDGTKGLGLTAGTAMTDLKGANVPIRNLDNLESLRFLTTDTYLKDGELKVSNGVQAFNITPAYDDILLMKRNDGTYAPIKIAGVNFDVTGDISKIGGEGAVRYNPTSKKFEGSNGTDWRQFNREVYVPVSATSNGFKGDYAVAGDWLYVCVNTNSWKRVALTAF